MLVELRRRFPDDRLVCREAYERADLLRRLAVEAWHVYDVAVVQHLPVLERLPWPADAFDGDVLILVEDLRPLGVRLGAHTLQHDLPERLGVGLIADGRQLGETFIFVDMDEVERLHLRETEVVDRVRELEPDAVLRDRC